MENFSQKDTFHFTLMFTEVIWYIENNQIVLYSQINIDHTHTLGELWDVYSEYFGEYQACYNGLHCIIVWNSVDWICSQRCHSKWPEIFQNTVCHFVHSLWRFVQTYIQNHQWFIYNNFVGRTYIFVLSTIDTTIRIGMRSLKKSKQLMLLHAMSVLPS